jgi:hypothetical protein
MTRTLAPGDALEEPARLLRLLVGHARDRLVYEKSSAS